MRVQATRAAVEPSTAAILEKILSVEIGQCPRAGLVQQTVQIVAAHDLTLIVMHHVCNASLAGYCE
jgi:hypothetical protein